MGGATIFSHVSRRKLDRVVNMSYGGQSGPETETWAVSVHASAGFLTDNQTAVRT